MTRIDLNHIEIIIKLPSDFLNCDIESRIPIEDVGFDVSVHFVEILAKSFET